MAEGPSICLSLIFILILTRAQVRHFTGILREAHKGFRWVYEPNGLGGWHTRQARGEASINMLYLAFNKLTPLDPMGRWALQVVHDLP